MGGSSNTTTNQASNQAQNQATNFATQAAQATANTAQTNTAQNTASNTAQTYGSNAASNTSGSNANVSGSNTNAAYAGQNASSTAGTSSNQSISDIISRYLTQSNQNTQGGSSGTTSQNTQGGYGGTTAQNTQGGYSGTTAQNTQGGYTGATNQNTQGGYTGTTAQNTQGGYNGVTNQNTSSSSTTGPVEAALKILQQSTGPISAGQIQNYISPYLHDVVRTTTGQQAQNNAVQQQALKGNAISQNALGGDRARIAQAELMRGQGLNDASTIAGLYDTGYRQALAAAQADRAAQLQAAGMMGTTTSGNAVTAGTAGGTNYANTAGTAAGTNYANTAGTAAGTNYANTAGTTGGTNYANTAGTAAGTNYANTAGTTAGTNYANTAGTTSGTSQQLQTGTTIGTSQQNMTGTQAGTSQQGTQGYSAGTTQGQTNAATQGYANTAANTATSGTSNTASQGLTQAATQGVQNTANAGASSTAGNSSTSTTPSPLGMGMAALSLLSDGGAVKKRADGGSIIPSAPVGFGQLPQWQMQSNSPPQAPAPQQTDLQHLQGIGKKARTGLENMLSKMDGNQGWTPKASETSNMPSSIGKGSNTEASAPQANVSQAYAPTASVETPVLPEMFAMGTPYAPMPSVEMPTVPQAQAADSGGKGSGGAVRGLADGGDAGIDFSTLGDNTGANADFSDAYRQFESPEQQKYHKFGMPWQSPPPPLDSPANADVRGMGAAVTNETPQGIGNLASKDTTSAQPMDLSTAYPLANPNGNPIPPVRYEPGGSQVLPNPQMAYAPQTAPANIGFGNLSGLAQVAPPQSSVDQDQPIPVKTEVFPTSQADLAKSDMGIIPSAQAAEPAPQSENATAGIADLNPIAVNDDEGKPATIQSIPNPAMPRSISGALETGQRDPLRGVGNVSPDTNGSFSVGNYGLNSQKGASAHQFMQQYGPELKGLGVTARPGTSEFNSQWKNAAQSDPETLHSLENDWYQKNVAAGVSGHMAKAGVPDGISADPRVQSYIADREVQQGTGSTENHANRLRQAAVAANGDPEKFLSTLSAIDKQHINGDFRTYLSQNPGNARGLINRIDNREAGAKGIGELDTGTQTQSGPAPGLGKVATALIQKGANPDPEQQHPYASKQDKRTGGLVERIVNGVFGGSIEFNPLNLTPSERMTMLHVGAALMKNGNPGEGLQAGLDYQSGIAKQDRQAQLDAMKLSKEFADLMKPIPGPKDAMGIEQGMLQYNPASRQYEKFTGAGATAPAHGVQGPLMIGSDLHGGDYLTKMEEVDPAAVATAKTYLDGTATVPSINSRTPPQIRNAYNMALQADPKFNQSTAKYRQEYVNPNKNVQKSLNSFETAIHHVNSLDDYNTGVSDTGMVAGNALYHGIQRQFGNTGLKSYEDTASAFGNEVDKAFVGGVGTGHEREVAQERVSSSLPKEARLAGNAANTELMIGKMLAFENQWKKANGGHSSPPPSLTDDEKAIARKVFEHEPDPVTRQKRYERLSKDPRTADLVSATGSAEAGNLQAARPTGVSRVEQARQQMQNNSTAPQSAPTPGQVYKGYRFKGGDPGQQSNWEVAQ